MKGFLRILRYLVLVIAVVAIFFTWQWYSLKKEAEAAFNHNPVIAQYLGKVSVEKMGLSVFAAQCPSGCEHYLMKLRGEKGNAMAVSDLSKGSEELSYAILCLSSGENIALTKDAELIVANERESACQ
ncbi:hypothetical protein EKN56_11260 [Limnobaculum zhutongyuii]|uniref:Uncharacterized protein n=1 Tax=Limnobaculum zhutongyuii TaxID=2498113 RepID=A0A411WL11_9GAMM|nr:hypothetical protein [Limnobaculum zhutongyuii]QBH96921.1 hypothetical protein EKN56_11260 [Limnobaculum zhutongyuii]TQS87025.1 hypothetical protein ELQ32_16575 [Limnobaculum zhutongyuii]